MKLYINTFGGLEMKVGGQSVLEESNRTYRLYKLFQYFLTFRNKKILPETIIDNLFSDSESVDPKNVLRTQIFRIRKIIKSLLPDDISENDYLNINFVNGYYCLEVGKSVILDIDEFESLINLGDLEHSNNSLDNTILLYENAVKLYKGSYLSENGYEVWVVPTRNYYQRLYLKTLYKLLNLLKEKEQYDQIIYLCEEALLIEPYEEDIHMYLIEAMLKLGQSKNALSHYDYTILLMEKEVGAKPSEKFIDLLKKIQSCNSKSETDIFSIKKRLDDCPLDGAIHCDYEYFKFLYNAQKRRELRDNEHDFLGLITLDTGVNYHLDTKKLSYWSNSMINILTGSLRKGDIFTFWNENQILILLHNVKENGAEQVEVRLKNKIKEYFEHDNYHMNISFRPLMSEELAQLI